MKTKVPRTMSTQHPDNARVPAFASSDAMAGEDEISEIYWVFSKLNCQEQMWDFEGKKALPWVVSELLMKNQDFFRKRLLGKEFFLTFRIPNPEIETVEAKLVAEVLDSIPRCYDAANAFYQKDIPPVFEVILPMTTSAEQLNRLYYYYHDWVVKRGDSKIFPGDTISMKSWLGEFRPEKINAIPLFEDKKSLLRADKIVEDFLKDKDVDYQRVFLARSDPALNYGTLSSVLLLNVALQRLYELQKRIGTDIYPILGVGSPPFRGNLKPTNVKSMLEGYPSCQTFTLQSAFKYNWPLRTVVRAIKRINSSRLSAPSPVDEIESTFVVEKAKAAYWEQMPEIASLVNRLTPFIPRRRLRKMHIGLFGYPRSVDGVQLPRAIPFCAALYSLGLPPELLGLHNLTAKDLEVVRDNYPSPNFEEDIKDALFYYNPKSLSLLSSKLKDQIEKVLTMGIIDDFETNEQHEELTSLIIRDFKKVRRQSLPKLIVKAANVRKFLG